MLSKAKIKYLQSLKQNKYRIQHESFIAEGSTNVYDFIKGPLTVQMVFGTEAWVKSHEQFLQKIPAEIVTTHDLEKISSLKNPSEILALIEKPSYSLSDIRQIDHFILALDDIKDPGNMGTIIRTADWFGIQDIICSEETVDAFNPKVVQATMGSLARVKIHYTSLSDYFKVKPSDLKIFGAMLNGAPLQSVSKPKQGILLIGSEAHGISKGLYPFIDQQIHIPSAKNSETESLNAAVATALVCYEFVVHKTTPL